MVMLEETDASPLTAPMFSAFKSFSTNLLAHTSEYVRTAAFSCEEKPPVPVNDFASYVFKILSKNEKLESARWFKFSRFKHNLKLT
jgi:hypothetical protein